MPAILSIGGSSPGDLGIEVFTTGALWSRAARERSYFRPFGRYGAIPSRSAHGDEKIVDIAIRVIAPIEDRRVALDRFWEATRGVFRVVWSDSTDRYHECLLDRAPTVAAFDREFLAWREDGCPGDLHVDAVLVIPQGVAWDIEPSSASVMGAEEVSITGGTAANGLLIQVPGPFTGLTVEMRSVTGDPVGDPLVLDAVASSTELLEIDTDLQRIVLEDLTTGDRTNGLDTFVSGDFPVLDPGMGTPGYGPTIVVSEDALILWRRAWE